MQCLLVKGIMFHISTDTKSTISISLYTLTLIWVGGWGWVILAPVSFSLITNGKSCNLNILQHLVTFY